MCSWCVSKSGAMVAGEVRCDGAGGDSAFVVVGCDEFLVVMVAVLR